MSAQPAITFAVDADGVGWISFDDPAARANVFNPENQAALGAAIDAAGESGAKAWVIVSGKPKTFIAGADLKWLLALPNAGEATELARKGQRLFQRLASSRAPVVCAIHGACAGGGFELALACTWRIASDAPATLIGLPETGIGTLPGWGGSVRLPRLIGVPAALDHILKAQLVPADEALKHGLVDEVAPAAELNVRAKSVALRLAAEGGPRRPLPPPTPAGFLATTKAAVAARQRAHVPAVAAVIDLVEQTQGMELEAALDREAWAFGDVTVAPACKNLIHVFFLREAAKKRTLEGWIPGRRGAAAATPVRRVGVVGAGVMGSGIAHWLAVRGFDVVLRDVQPEFVERGRAVIRGLFEEAVKRGRMSRGDAEVAEGRIATTTAWKGFAACDLVIEAIVEDAGAKQNLFRELAAVVKPDAILASNTSALPIEEIGAQVGIHFFNPVGRMPLVELIVGKSTSADSAERALALVKALGKSPVICRSAPGFLVTRVLFFYLNEAVRLWEEGVPTETIDAALRDFGWPMGPLRLIDEVGVDVTDFIFGEMAHYFPGRFVRTTATAKLLAAGLRGRKNGAGRGFYRYEGKVEAVNDEAAALCGGTRERFSKSSSSSLQGTGIADRLMAVMIAEAQRCLDEGVVKSPDDIDFALLSGAGFPAWRGGLMRYAASRVILSAAKNPAWGAKPPGAASV
jgi:3-hydroxyacyl-CoA dehydrogenase/enoyl-CoA hydratase/3-hydroxybutyryl-CoA epimerase